LTFAVACAITFGLIGFGAIFVIAVRFMLDD